MSKTKGKGKVSQKTPRRGKRLGVKIFGGQQVNIGSILVRQNGTKFHPGEGTKMGRDFTIFAMRRGLVRFKKRKGKKIICVF